jgi:hypothetical protein
MDIVSRASWGARPPKSRVTGDTVRETFLHHTAGSGSGAAYMRSIQNHHMDAQGWADIAYNFVIDPKTLTVYEGRGWGVRPGSQKSYNTGTWSVCVMGNFQTQTPTQGLLETIAGLIRFGHELGRLPLVLTGGHRDAPGQSTSCPGSRLHSRIPDIRNLLEDTMAVIRQPSWLPNDVLDRLAKQNIEPRDLETEDMWRFLTFLDRHTRFMAGQTGSGVPRAEYDQHRHAEGTTGPPK